MTAVNLFASKPGDGCTVCHTRDTVLMSAFTGRRCAAHAPEFDLSTAVALATTDAGAALDYIRSWPA